MIKNYLIGGALSIAVVMGIAWYRGKIEEAELRGQLEEINADVVEAQQARDSMEAYWQPIVERLRGEVDSLTQRQESMDADLRIATREAGRWRRRYDEVRNDTSATIGDIIEAADSTVATATEEARSCSLALQNCATITKRLKRQNVAANDRLQAERNLNAQQTRKIAALEAGRPGSPILPWVVAGIALALAGLAGAAIVF